MWQVPNDDVLGILQTEGEREEERSCPVARILAMSLHVSLLPVDICEAQDAKLEPSGQGCRTGGWAAKVLQMFFSAPAL